MAESCLISLDEVKTSEEAQKGGGKFYGLFMAQKLLREKICSEIDVVIPKTFVLTTEAFEKVKFEEEKAIIPNDVVNQAMQALVMCGGNAAVRSSADVEDQSGNTYSGEFESVLNVKNKAQMIKALEKVYASLGSLDNARMGVIIQKMVDKPLFAGVAYSKDLNGDEKVVVNYVEDKTADKMIVGQEEGKVMKLNKHAYLGQRMELLLPDNLSKTLEAEVFRTLQKSGEADDCTNYFPTYALHHVMVLVNKLEEKFGYPMDVEFAAGKNEKGEPKIFLLQQRPYIAADNYKIKFLPNGDYCGYKVDEGSLVEGEALVWDELFGAGQNDPRYISDEIMKDKIIIMNYSKSRNDFKTDREYVLYKRNSLSRSVRAIWNQKHIKAKALIDRFHIIEQLMHGHWGNQLQEKGMPFYMRNLKPKDHTAGCGFEDVKSGDRIRVNLDDGSYEILERKHELKYAPLRSAMGNLDIAKLKYRGK